MSESTKGGNVILERIHVPEYVEPGEPFSVDAVVSNGALGITFFDKDKCSAQNPGYSLEVVFRGYNGEEKVAGPACHEMTSLGKKTETYSKTLTAPQSGGGSMNVEVFVRLPGSGKQTDAITKTVTVSETEPKDSDPPGDDTSDESDDNNDDDGGGNNPLKAIFPFLFPDGGGGGGLNALLGVVVLLAIAWMLDSGSDIAG